MNLLSLIFGNKPREVHRADELEATIRSDTHEIRRRLSNIESIMDELLEQQRSTKRDEKHGILAKPHN